jgi:hypothetical protein
MSIPTDSALLLFLVSSSPSPPHPPKVGGQGGEVRRPHPTQTDRCARNRASVLATLSNLSASSAVLVDAVVVLVHDVVVPLVVVISVVSVQLTTETGNLQLLLRQRSGANGGHLRGPPRCRCRGHHGRRQGDRRRGTRRPSGGGQRPGLESGERPNKPYLIRKRQAGGGEEGLCGMEGRGGAAIMTNPS